MSKSATYHQPAGPVILDVLKNHSDGTVDLGVDGRVIITKCPVAEKAGDGSCILIEDESAEKAAAKTKEKPSK